MKTRHLSLRIPEETYERLEDQGKRTRQNLSELARTLIEEGLRMEAHPGIIFVPGATGRRARLTNGPDIWEVIRGYQISEGEGAEKIASLESWSSVNRYQLATALRYYAEFPDEIDERIASNNEIAERAYAEWLQQQPQPVS